MDNISAASFFDKEVKTRFPNWKPGEALVLDWLGWLKSFDFAVARSAIQQHAFETRLTYPILKDLYAIAKKIQPERRDNGQMTGKCCQPYAAYYIIDPQKLDVTGKPVKYGFFTANPNVTFEQATKAGHDFFAEHRNRFSSDAYVEIGERFENSDKFEEVPF